MTAKLIKCNLNNEYGPSSAVKRVPKCKKIKEDKRKKTAFILN